MAVTMKKIAELAGVSQPAVSAALSLSSSARVSEEVRQRVLRIAAELNYRPNASAQRLKGCPSRTIGIFGVPYVSVLAQAQMLELSIELEEHGFNLLACYGRDDAGSRRAIDDVLSRGVDGFLITTPENPFRNFERRSVPYVCCPPCETEDFDVAIDHRAGLEQAVKALYGKGRRRFGFVSLSHRHRTHGNPSFEKYEGMCRGMAQYALQLDYDPFLGLDAERDKSAFLQRVQALRLDALLCCNDYVALQVENMLLSAGVSIPDEVMIVGYDGLGICDLAAVPLATVIQPNTLLARTAVKLLLERIQEKNLEPSPARIMLNSYFYPSCSTGDGDRDTQKFLLEDTFSTLELNRRFCKDRPRTKGSKL